MKRKFAAFDIDGTIGRTSLFLQIVDELIRREHLPKSFLFDLESKIEDYKKRSHANAFGEYTNSAVDILFENLKSISIKDYREAVDTIIVHAREYVYVYTRDLIEKLRDEGYFLIAISGSEMYAVQEFAARYKFDVAIGETYYEKDGLSTGEFEAVFHKKDVFIKALVEEHDLTFEGSVAIGDSMGDHEMLELVETLIAFNPEARLYDYARERGWKIVVERKNVIYELEPGQGNYQLRPQAAQR